MPRGSDALYDKCLSAFCAAHPEVLARAGRRLILRALCGAYLAFFPREKTTLFQTDKPALDMLQSNGFQGVSDIGAPYDFCLVFATKHKEETLFHIAKAVSVLSQRGTLALVAANDIGALSLKKQAEKLVGSLDSFSKSKRHVFWKEVAPESVDRQLLKEYLAKGDFQRIGGTPFVACPGVFSWQRIDGGSRLLAACLPDALAGKGADLGCGWGYLSHAALSRKNAVSEMHLFEAELKALAAARENLKAFKDKKIHFHFSDVTQDIQPAHDFDFVLMNPPFHAAKNADYALGSGFIRAAGLLLKPGGVLYLVANRHLPYERVLAACGFSFSDMAADKAFKVLQARLK